MKLHVYSLRCARVAAAAILLAQTGGAAGQPAEAESAGLQLIDTSVNVLIAGGGSSADKHDLLTLQGGGHDPRRNGFTLQGAEISFSGAVDPYFAAEAYVLATEDEVELEEAFATSTALPLGLELKAGMYLTEFGRINPTHPHDWYWLDQPIVASRLLGPDGLRAPGARLAWLMPTPWYSQINIGVQNADNESAISFLGEGHRHGDDHGEHDHAHGDEENAHGHEMDVETTVAGRPRVEREPRDLDEYLYSIRWENSFDVSEQSTFLLGLSALHGPNASSDGGETIIYGADLTLKWRPTDAKRGYPFIIWQSEVMKRDYKADAVSIAHEDHLHDFPAETIRDWGFYSQIVWGFAPRWETGLRVESAGGNDAGVEERDHDPLRADRLRVSPMVAYRPSEFSRVRLQYNYDDADFLDEEVHTVWAGLEVLIGKHPAHKF
jgi:hypothetical protein